MGQNRECTNFNYVFVGNSLCRHRRRRRNHKEKFQPIWMLSYGQCNEKKTFTRADVRLQQTHRCINRTADYAERTSDRNEMNVITTAIQFVGASISSTYY